MGKGNRKAPVQRTQEGDTTTNVSGETTAAEGRALASGVGSSSESMSLVPSEQFAALVKTVVREILEQPSFLAVIAEAVTKKVVETLQETMDFNGHKISELESQLAECKQENLRLHKELSCQLDDLQQYQRRNNIRIFGLEERAGEDTDQLVLKVASDIGADITLADLDRTHRVGPKVPGNTRPRPIICKFVSYAKRREVFSKKRQLRGSGVTIREDLTTARLELLKSAANKYGPKNTWSTDGSVFVVVQGVRKRIAGVADIK